MKLKTTNKQVIQEVPYGMLVWECPDGEILGDEDGNIMHVFTTNQDPAKYAASVKALTEAARGYGFPEGRAVFWAGRRPISDEELEHQLARAAQGLIPDPLDLGAINDEARALKQQND